MKITDRPLQIDRLKAIEELQGGHKGVVFLLTNAAQGGDERLVVKLQHESNVEAVAGTKIMHAAGARAPAVRPAAVLDRTRISLALATLPRSFAEVVRRYHDEIQRFPNVLLMEFAQGATLKKVRTEQIDDFLAALADPMFQQELGRMLAGDAFSGNRDRMFGVRTEHGVRGWYHEQNTFIQKDAGGGYHAVGIDNSFDPDVVPYTLPWGKHVVGRGIQWGSIASAYRTYAREEAEQLFDLFIRTALASHRDDPATCRRIETARGLRAGFADQVSRSANVSMQGLLQRNQHWKAQLADAKATDQMLQQFRLRKRLLRQVAAGVEPQRAWERAQDDAKYTRWKMLHDIGMSRQQATAVMNRSVQAYRDMKGV